MGLSRFLVLFGIVLVACGGGGKAPVAAPQQQQQKSDLAVPSLSTQSKISGQSFGEALAAVDAGELERADTILREMVRQDPGRKDVSDLLGAIQKIGGRGGEVAPHLLANVKAKTVHIAAGTAAPSPASAKARVSIASQKSIGSSNEDPGPFFTDDPVSKLSDRLFHSRGARGMAEMGMTALPKGLPSTYAGKKLVTIVPHRTDPDRWLLFFGADIGHARYVALVGGAASPMVVDLGDLDRGPLHLRTHEIGNVVWAEADGDTLYAETWDQRGREKESTVPRNSSITAIDMKTGNVLWHSAENVADAGSFVVTDAHIITSFEDAEKSRIVMLDRKTGGVAATLHLPMTQERAIVARGLYVKDKKLRGRASTDDVTFKVDGDGGALAKMPDHALVTTESLAGLLRENVAAGTKKIDRHTLSPAAIEKRAKAVAEMSEHPFESVVALRDLVQFGEAAGNLATETLLETASARLREMREQAAAKVEAAPVLKIAPLNGAPAKPAPITHELPAFRLKKTAEMISKTFLEAFEDDFLDLPQMAIDKPWPGHLGDLPEYMPAQMPPKRLLFDAYYADGDDPKSANAIVGMYGGLTAVFDTKKHAADRQLDFSAFKAPSEFPQTGHMLLSGNVAFVIVASSGGGGPGPGTLLCFDRKTGEMYWMNEDSGLYPRLVIDGFLVATAMSKKGQSLSDLVVVDGVNGKELSREAALKIQGVLRFNEKELRAGSFTSRYSFELVRP